MRQRTMRVIAKRWWRAVEKWHPYDYDRVERLLRNENLVAALLRALVATAPTVGPRYVGTAILEGIYYTAEFKNVPNKALEYLLAARLSTRENIAVLAGVWPDMLLEWGIREKLADVLTTEQIDWLVDPTSPGRNDYSLWQQGPGSDPV